MASTSDSVVYDLSMQSEKLGEQFTSKQWLNITDSNNGSYNGQIVLESSSLANSGRWLSYSEGLITIPVIYHLRITGAAVAAFNSSPFVVGTKCGWHQIIDSIEVQFGNTSVQQISPYTNILTQFKMLTSFSQDGVAKYGALLNFFPDSTASYRYIGAAADGEVLGVSNNVLLPAATYAYVAAQQLPLQANEGLLKRLYTYNLTPNSAPTYTAGQGIQDFKDVRRGYFDSFAVDGVMYKCVRALATIRLKDVSDFCKKLGLTKGGFLKLTINYNSARTSIVTADAGRANIAPGANTQLSGRTNPLLIGSTQANHPLAAIAVTANTPIIVEFGVFRTSALPNAGPIDTSCRLWVPAYTMNAEYESAYIQSKPISEIVYQDAYQYTIGKIGATANFAQLLTNGIIDPQYLVVVPFYTTNLPGQNIPLLQSPFTSEGGTTSPVAIQQFQVQLSGKNMFNQDVGYDWQAFQGEMASINALNGGITDELTSGLIGFNEWSSIYRYYVCDLSRGSEGDKFIPKAVLVSGKNITAYEVDYICFIVFNRTLKIRTSNSEIIM